MLNILRAWAAKIADRWALRLIVLAARLRP